MSHASIASPPSCHHFGGFADTESLDTLYVNVSRFLCKIYTWKVKIWGGIVAVPKDTVQREGKLDCTFNAAM